MAKLTSEEKAAIKELNNFLNQFKPTKDEPELRLIWWMLKVSLTTLKNKAKSDTLTATTEYLLAERFFLNTGKLFEAWIDLTPWPTESFLNIFQEKISYLAKMRCKRFPHVCLPEDKRKYGID